MSTNVYGDISPNTAGGMTAIMLKVAQTQAVLERFGQVDTQPKNKGKTRTFRRYHSLPPATAPLAEGITPQGQKIRFTNYEATLEQYGDYVELTDIVVDTHTDPVLQEMSRRCGDQIVDTVEMVRFGILKGGTNVYLAGGVASRSLIATSVSKNDLRKVYRGLKRARAMEISSVISATPKIGTMPVGRAYFACCHTDLDADLRNVAGFIPVEQYGDGGTSALQYEIGKIENIRFLCTTMFEPFLEAGASGSTLLTGGSSGTGNADVYPILIFGQDAYGLVPLQGQQSVTPSVLQPNTPRSSDQLGQRGHVGWKLMTTCVITNELWMARLEVGASNLS